MSATIEVRVLLFGALSEIAATAALTVALPEGARIADAVARVRERFPDLGPRLDGSAVALNLAYAGREAGLRAGDEVALIPPVSGG